MKTDKYLKSRLRKQHIVWRAILASVMILSIIGLLSPGTALAHTPGVTQRVSVDSNGNEGNAASAVVSGPAISADGRFVAFDSTATNLIAGGNLPFNIFVHDRLTGTTELVSVSSSGREGWFIKAFESSCHQVSLL